MCGHICQSVGETKPNSAAMPTDEELDWVVGELLGKFDELGIAENTIVALLHG